MIWGSIHIYKTVIMLSHNVKDFQNIFGRLSELSIFSSILVTLRLKILHHTPKNLKYIVRGPAISSILYATNHLCAPIWSLSLLLLSVRSDEARQIQLKGLLKGKSRNMRSTLGGTALGGLKVLESDSARLYPAELFDSHDTCYCSTKL